MHPQRQMHLSQFCSSFATVSHHYFFIGTCNVTYMFCGRHIDQTHDDHSFRPKWNYTTHTHTYAQNSTQMSHWSAYRSSFNFYSWTPLYSTITRTLIWIGFRTMTGTDTSSHCRWLDQTELFLPSGNHTDESWNPNIRASIIILSQPAGRSHVIEKTATLGERNGSGR